MLKLAVESFLDNAVDSVVVDVRSPAEFAKGHIPEAVNLPLFSNSERAIVGTKYKQENRESAVRAGIDIVTPKMSFYFSELEKLKLDNKKLLLYCWRGGMRSRGMAQLFRAAGYQTHILEKGYKSYRQSVLACFELPFKLLIIGGMTGSGKSYVLKELVNLGEQIVDLEEIAHHKGSAFGALGQEDQPTVEQFENFLHHKLRVLDPQKTIWLEDESRLIGKVSIPKHFFTQMRSTRVIKLEMSKELRIKRLMREYTDFQPQEIINSIQNISRRLGGKAAAQAVEAVLNQDFYTAIDIVLSYYDKTYAYGLSKRDQQNVVPLKINEDNPRKIAQTLLESSFLLYT